MKGVGGTILLGKNRVYCCVSIRNYTPSLRNYILESADNRQSGGGLFTVVFCVSNSSHNFHVV